ncbi:unnamed protein product [Dracunculus medinensis]|uniref:Uncharacterized protein n=1 Tax=Dracunculus medinensis TaxID=318479 RepID=A0A0N4U378_DRAME|nr:unnamed protein product [Dracunculus medinensis]
MKGINICCRKSKKSPPYEPRKNKQKVNLYRTKENQPSSSSLKETSQVETRIIFDASASDSIDTLNMINFYQNSCNKETEDGWVAVAVEQQRNHGDPYSTEIHKKSFDYSILSESEKNTEIRQNASNNRKLSINSLDKIDFTRDLYDIGKTHSAGSKYIQENIRRLARTEEFQDITKAEPIFLMNENA